MVVRAANLCLRGSRVKWEVDMAWMMEQASLIFLDVGFMCVHFTKLFSSKFMWVCVLLFLCHERVVIL